MMTGWTVPLILAIASLQNSGGTGYEIHNVIVLVMALLFGRQFDMFCIKCLCDCAV